MPSLTGPHRMPQLWRSAGIGIGAPRSIAPVPTPFWQLLDGKVFWPFVEYRSLLVDEQRDGELGRGQRRDLRGLPGRALVNGHVTDTQAKIRVPSVLFKPVWVTTKNMKSTVIADKYVAVSRLCAGAYATACKAAGITP